MNGEEAISKYCDTVDGKNPSKKKVGSLSHYLQGSIHPRWCKISAINSMSIFFSFMLCDSYFLSKFQACLLYIITSMCLYRFLHGCKCKIYCS